jgi:hypothetical protein
VTPKLKVAPSAPATPPVDGVQSGQTPQPAGLLLPAIQKAREAATEEPAPNRSKGKVEYQFKVEEGEK